MYDLTEVRDNRSLKVAENKKTTGSESAFGQKIYSLFRTNENALYIVCNCGDHHEVWAIDSEEFKLLVYRQFYMDTGSIPKTAKFKKFLSILKAKAMFDSPTCEVFVRVARVADAIYIDLANEKWEQIKIAKDGWGVISCIESPARFIRIPGMLPLPRPSKGGSLNALHQFLNVKNEDDFKLIVGWMLGALNPDGPFPILILHGGEGSAKTTTLKMICGCIDPAKAILRSISESERDLLITASRSWMQSFDNVSNIRPRMHDALCRLSTGGGGKTRKVYTNNSEQIFEAKRPIILNGISHFATQNDFLDRSIIVNLPPFSGNRKPEKELENDFEIEKPSILGALYDAISTAMANLDQVKLSNYSRMADFEDWVTAAEPALGWKEGTFIEVYRKNRAEVVNVAIDSNPLCEAVLKFMKRRSDWSGTATQLLEELKRIVPKSIVKIKEWPKSPNALSNNLMRSEVLLRSKGIEIIREPRKADKRTLRLRRIPQNAPSSTKTEEKNQKSNITRNINSYVKPRETYKPVSLLSTEVESEQLSSAENSTPHNTSDHSDSGVNASDDLLVLTDIDDIENIDNVPHRGTAVIEEYFPDDEQDYEEGVI